MKISVVIPAYNRSALLAETLKSVIAQDRRADEIIVVDDGSKEDIRSVITDISDQIKYVSQKNGGLGAARSTGMEHVTGDAVCFLDSDDLFLPQALNDLEQALESKPSAIAAIGECEFMNNDGTFAGFCPMNLMDTSGPQLWLRLIKTNMIRTSGCVLMRRESIVAAGGWEKTRELRGNEDWDMWLRLSDVGEFVKIPKIVLRYRVHSTSMSHNTYFMIMGTVNLFKKHVAREKKNPMRKTLASDGLRLVAYNSLDALVRRHTVEDKEVRASSLTILFHTAAFVPFAIVSRIRVGLGAMRRKMTSN